VFFVSFVLVLCLVYTMLPFSLDCSFLVVPSVFSNVYLTAVLHICIYPDRKYLFALVLIIVFIFLFVVNIVSLHNIL